MKAANFETGCNNKMTQDYEPLPESMFKGVDNCDLNSLNIVKLHNRDISEAWMNNFNNVFWLFTVEVI